VWNSRLVWHAYEANLYTMDQTEYVTDIIATTNVLAQKFVVPDWTLIGESVNSSILSARTAWMPALTPDGEQLLVGVGASEGALGMLAVVAGAAFQTLAAWVTNYQTAMPIALTGQGVAESDGMPCSLRQGKEPAPSSTGGGDMGAQ